MSNHLKKAWYKRIWVRVCLAMMVVLVGLGFFFRTELLPIAIYFEIKFPSVRVDQQIKDQLDGKTPVPAPSGKVVFRYAYDGGNEKIESYFAHYELQVYENRVVVYSGGVEGNIRHYFHRSPVKIYYVLTESQFNELEQTLIDVDFANSPSVSEEQLKKYLFVNPDFMTADFAKVKGQKTWVFGALGDTWRYRYAAYRLWKNLGLYSIVYPNNLASMTGLELR